MTRSQETIAIICLHEDAPAESVRLVLRELGFGAGPDPRWRRHGKSLLTVRLKGPDATMVNQLDTLPGVHRAFWLKGNRLFERWPVRGDSTVHLVNGAVFGGNVPVVIAGPCSVEGEAQVLRAAERVAEAGAKALRGGVFKPRTSPYDFGGLGEEGLGYLAKARERTGLPLVTEVLDSSNLDLVVQYADVLQIGSRNMHNTPLLFQIGAHPSGRPALLKRGFGATVEEFLEAAEYVLLGRIAAGHDEPGLILCERGIRTFEGSTRFTLDLGAIPVIRKRSHLPVIADPSHAAGARDFVVAHARAALAAGADGLLVEVHPNPSLAWCDAAHSLDPVEFHELMRSVPGRGFPADAVPNPVPILHRPKRLPPRVAARHQTPSTRRNA